jgi:hypothetical protein
LTDRSTSGLAPCEPDFLPGCDLEGFAEASADVGGEVAGVAWRGTSELAVLAPRLPCVSESPATTAATTSAALAATDTSMRRDIRRRRLRRLAIPRP